MILQAAAQKQTREGRKEARKARVEKVTGFSGVQFSGSKQEEAPAGDTGKVPW